MSDKLRHTNKTLQCGIIELLLSSHCVGVYKREALEAKVR